MVRAAPLAFGLLFVVFFLCGLFSSFSAAASAERSRRSFVFWLFALLCAVIALEIFDPADVQSWLCVLGGGLVFLVILTIARAIQARATASFGMDDRLDRVDHPDEE